MYQRQFSSEEIRKFAGDEDPDAFERCYNGFMSQLIPDVIRTIREDSDVIQHVVKGCLQDLTMPRWNEKEPEIKDADDFSRKITELLVLTFRDETPNEERNLD